MATDSILRLKVESTEYEGKIKRAAQGLQRLEESCHNAGGTLAYLSKEEKAFVEGLGKMETASKNVKGKIGELTDAFQNLSAQYNRLTKEEKEGDYGKALSKSLVELKQRIKDGKAELNNINKELGSQGSLLDAIASKYGISTTMLKSYGLALAGISAALKLAHDAFFASEKNLDDWDRAVYSSKSAYEAFLTSINTGDISGFMSRIGQIVKGANDAYDALDRLGTQKAINNAAYQKQNAENERIRAMIRTGRYIAPNDGRKANMPTGTVLTKEQIAALSKQLENGMAKINEIVKSEISTTSDAIEKLYDELANQLGISKEAFLQSTKTMEDFDKAIEGYNNWKKWEADHTTTTSYSTNTGTYTQSTRDNSVNPYEAFKWAGVFKDDGDLFKKINELITQRAALQVQNYSNTANAYKAINKASGGTGGNGGGKQSGFTEGQISQLIAEANQATGIFDQLSDSSIALKDVWLDLMTAPTEWVDEVDTDLEKLIEKMYKTQKAAKATGEGFRSAMSATSQLGGALASLDNPAAKILGTIGQAIATVAMAYSDALAKDESSKFNIWSFIAASTAATISMVSTIASIKSATSGSYADGGIIPGNIQSGDHQIAQVNAGELILNKAQQSAIASQLQSGSRASAQPYVSGEMIWLGLNNYMKRTGRGEIVTSK